MKAAAAEPTAAASRVLQFPDRTNGRPAMAPRPTRTRTVRVPARIDCGTAYNPDEWIDVDEMIRSLVAIAAASPAMAYVLYEMVHDGIRLIQRERTGA